MCSKQAALRSARAARTARRFASTTPSPFPARSSGSRTAAYVLDDDIRPRPDEVLVDLSNDVVMREVGNAAPGFVVHRYSTSLKLASHAPVDDDDPALG